MVKCCLAQGEGRGRGIYGKKTLIEENKIMETDGRGVVYNSVYPPQMSFRVYFWMSRRRVMPVG